MNTVVNLTKHVLRFGAFRADGLLIYSHDCPQQGCFMISQSDIGDADWFLLLPFQSGAQIPPRVGLQSGTEGGGGGASIGLSIMGTGGSFGVSASRTVTLPYSDPFLAAEVGLNQCVAIKETPNTNPDANSIGAPTEFSIVDYKEQNTQNTLLLFGNKRRDAAAAGLKLPDAQSNFRKTDFGHDVSSIQVLKGTWNIYRWVNYGGGSATVSETGGPNDDGIYANTDDWGGLGKVRSAKLQ